MHLKIWSGLLLLVLGGCSSNVKMHPGKMLYNSREVTEAENRLVEAAESIDRSLAELAAIEKNLHPEINKNLDKNLPKIFELEQLINLDWNGPVENLLIYLAKSIDYRFTTLGTLLGTPILVTLSVKNTTVGEVLKNINLQCGHKANVVVNPSKKLLELHYVR